MSWGNKLSRDREQENSFTVCKHLKIDSVLASQYKGKVTNSFMHRKFFFPFCEMHAALCIYFMVLLEAVTPGLGCQRSNRA